MPNPTPTAVLTDKLAARLRTLWPMFVGHLIAAVIVHAGPVLDIVEQTTGYRPTSATMTLAGGLLAGALVYEAGRWLEARPGPGRPARIARNIGRYLLSLGVPTGQPSYKH
ncbi:hypothetical protein ACIBSW_06750 [Actinoplanes sp. NPDC049668]|uniref:hypothetical protein n=1 Tax=unclassified Actinoplanes TaxID=2626549 RepID=UPI00339DB118